MEAHVYEDLIARHASSWNAPAPAATGLPAPAYPGVASIGADGEAHQCRVPDLGVDAAGQHHDTGAFRQITSRPDACGVSPDGGEEATGTEARAIGGPIQIAPAAPAGAPAASAPAASEN